MSGFALLPPEGLVRIMENNYVIIIPELDGNNIFEKLVDEETIILLIKRKDYCKKLIKIRNALNSVMKKLA